MKNICYGEECEWYAKPKPGDYNRSCYYGESQCWRGWLWLMISIIGLALLNRARANKQ